MDKAWFVFYRSEGRFTMKMFSGLLLIALAVYFGVMHSPNAQLQGSSRPPGIPEENWISISDTVGVAMIGGPPVGPAMVADNGLAWFVEKRSGTLMIRQDGAWIAFESLGEYSPDFPGSPE